MNENFDQDLELKIIFADNYKVSLNAVKLYVKIHGQNPSLAYDEKLWNEIKKELQTLDRHIKIKKLLRKEKLLKLCAKL